MKTTFGFLGILAVTLALQSCNDRDNGYEITSIAPLKTDSVRIDADTMTVQMMQEIRTYSTYQSGCEGFYDYDYIPNQMERKVVPYKFKTDAPCGSNTVAGWNVLRFRPVETGTYLFKFWQGKDTGNNDIWLEKNIVVTE